MDGSLKHLPKNKALLVQNLSVSGYFKTLKKSSGEAQYSRRIFSVLLRRANAIKMPDQHK